MGFPWQMTYTIKASNKVLVRPSSLFNNRNTSNRSRGCCRCRAAHNFPAYSSSFATHLMCISRLNSAAKEKHNGISTAGNNVPRMTVLGSIFINTLFYCTVAWVVLSLMMTFTPGSATSIPDFMACILLRISASASALW